MMNLSNKVAIVTGASREIGAAMAEALAAAGAAVLAAHAVAEFGRLDIFAANAGLTIGRPFLETDESTWDTLVNLNLKGSFFGAQAAARQMIAQGSGGRIVFSSSVTG